MRGKMLTNKALVQIVLSILLLSGLALGGYDLSEGEDAKNMSLAQFDALGTEGLGDEAGLVAGAPQFAATDQGTEVAAYIDRAPSMSELGKVQSFDIGANYPMYIFYDGDYLAWNDFAAEFPSNKPGLWVERAAGWSWYATLPLGGWTQELLYVPYPSPITLYEIYPGGFVRGYDLGFAAAGYHLIWYYADSPGRHSTILATNGGYSNAVVIDVYSRKIPTPKPIPDPKKECESRSTSTQICEWRDGRCQCYMRPVPNPVAECQSKSNDRQICDWIDGACKCWPRPAPNPVAECQARSNDEQTCDWIDGACRCVPKPAPNPVAECEKNPQCDWVNGNCYCRGINPDPEPEPMPGPVPNPYPEPDPFDPAPNPVSQCESNPSCHWSNGRCYCTGYNPDDSGGNDYEEINSIDQDTGY